MIRISPEDAKSRFGISTLHNLMENGERRFRLFDSHGRGYVRTDAGEGGAWQNSHLHRHLLETYIVQFRWIAVAQLTERRKIAILILREHDVWTSPIGVAHNVYMPDGAITHVVKHGSGSANDWETTEETELLDRLSKSLSEEEIIQVAEPTPT